LLKRSERTVPIQWNDIQLQHSKNNREEEMTTDELGETQRGRLFGGGGLGSGFATSSLLVLELFVLGGRLLVLLVFAHQIVHV